MLSGGEGSVGGEAGKGSAAGVSNKGWSDTASWPPWDWMASSGCSSSGLNSSTQAS